MPSRGASNQRAHRPTGTEGSTPRYHPASRLYGEQLRVAVTGGPVGGWPVAHRLRFPASSALRCRLAPPPALWLARLLLRIFAFPPSGGCGAASIGSGCSIGDGGRPVASGRAGHPRRPSGPRRSATAPQRPSRITPGGPPRLAFSLRIRPRICGGGGGIYRASCARLAHDDVHAHATPGHELPDRELGRDCDARRVQLVLHRAARMGGAGRRGRTGRGVARQPPARA